MATKHENGLGQFVATTTSDAIWDISMGGVNNISIDPGITSVDTHDFVNTDNRTWDVHTECLFGHNVTEWAEYLDGQCVGFCSTCQARIQATRMPGGIPFMRIKARTEMILATPEDAEHILELNEIEDLLDREEQAIAEARALLAVARKSARCLK